MSGIDWGQIDAAGNALKAELLNEVVQVGPGQGPEMVQGQGPKMERGRMEGLQPGLASTAMDTSIPQIDCMPYAFLHLIVQACEPLELDPPGAAGPGAVTKLAAGAAGPAKRGPRDKGGRGRGAGGARRGGRGGGEDEDEDEDGETRRQEVQQEDAEEEDEEEEDEGTATRSSGKREWRDVGGQGSQRRQVGQGDNGSDAEHAAGMHRRAYLAAPVPCHWFIHRPGPTCALLVPSLNFIPSFPPCFPAKPSWT